MNDQTKCENCGHQLPINMRIRVEPIIGNEYHLVCSFMCGFSLRKKLTVEKHEKNTKNQTKGQADSSST